MPFGICPDKSLGKERAKRINGDVARASFPAWYKQLMEFVGAGEGHGNEKGEKGPVKAPATAVAADPVENGHAEDAEFGDMGQLADCEMQQMQPAATDGGEEPSEQREEYSGRLVAREVLRGKKGNENSND